MNRLLLLTVSYLVTGWLGLQIPYAGTHITLVWLPAGIAVAAMLRWGWRLWPGVYLAALLVNLAIEPSLSLAASIAVGNTLSAVLCAQLLARFDFHQAFDRQKDVGRFFVAVALSMLLSALLGAASLYLHGAVPASGLGLAALWWWLGDVVGALLAAPPLLTLSRRSLQQLGRSRREGLLWLAMAVPVLWLSFLHNYGPLGHSLPLAFLSFPLFAWAALRFGVTAATLASLIFSVAAAVGVGTGYGTFSLPDPHVSLFLMWIYMALTVLTGLLITALQVERLQAENTLRVNEEKLRGLYELAPLGIVLTDMQGRYLEFNQAFLDICGYAAAEMAQLDYWQLTPGKYADEEARQLEALRERGHYGPYEKEYIRKDGSLVPLRLNGILLSMQDGRQLIWSIVEDISAQRRNEADLRVAASAFEAQVGILVTDARRVILKVNQAFSASNGYTAQELIGRTPRLLQSGRHGASFYAEMWAQIRHSGVWEGEVWDRRKNGEVFPKWLTITAIRDSQQQISHYVGTEIDITARKAAEEEIKYLAFFDALTGLPNRRLLQDRLRQVVAHACRSQRHGAMLFIDLDGFKTLNDSLGHDHGDMLLQQVAQRLSGCVRGGDTVARLGGDEFVIMLEGLGSDAAQAASLAEVVGDKVLAALQKPYWLNGHEYNGTSSIGVTLFGDQEQSIDNLLKQADLAMYQAKACGRNALRFFDPQMQREVDRRAALQTELHNAVRLGEIIPYLQAQVDGQGRLSGAELLVRWRHPRRGMVLPDDFISLAEDTGLILTLGRQVLEFACQQLATWSLRPETAHLTLAVNVSLQQLRQAGFVAQVQAILQYTAAAADKLKLELTESVLMDNVEDAIVSMNALNAIGVGFALDDFGIGYSSLSHLRRLPLEALKIDRSFVRDIVDNPGDARIAKTIISLAQGLGLEVIAEGVETEAQRALLVQHGCRVFQGNLFSPPLPLAEFENMLIACADRSLPLAE